MVLVRRCARGADGYAAHVHGGGPHAPVAGGDLAPRVYAGERRRPWAARRAPVVGEATRVAQRGGSRAAANCGCRVRAEVIAAYVERAGHRARGRAALTPVRRAAAPSEVSY